MAHSRIEIMVDKKILIIGDDLETQYLLTDALSQGEFQISATPTRISSILQFGLIQPSLLIFDMPQADTRSWEILERIRELSPVPVIALLADNDYEARIASLDRGADYCLVKPVNVQELQARVRALLRRAQKSQHFSPQNQAAPYIQKSGLVQAS
jgi:DNA-binding response OmpR family regulator